MLEFVGIEVLPSFGLFGPIIMSEEDVNAEIEKYKELFENYNLKHITK